MNQKITSHLWFDKEALEAAEFYTSIFESSKMKSKTTIYNTPSGDTDLVTVELSGQEFTLISAGPLFKFNPSVSFLVACKAKEEVDRLWSELSAGGKALMDLGTYPFSERYGWIQDKYGLSWQVVANIMDDMMRDEDEKRKARVTEAFLKMKKFDIEALKKAYRG